MDGVCKGPHVYFVHGLVVNVGRQCLNSVVVLSIYVLESVCLLLVAHKVLEQSANTPCDKSLNSRSVFYLGT